MQIIKRLLSLGSFWYSLVRLEVDQPTDYSIYHSSKQAQSVGRLVVRSHGRSYAHSVIRLVSSVRQSVNLQQSIANHSLFALTVFSPSWLSVSLFRFLPRLNLVLLHLHLLRRYSPQNHPRSFSTRTPNRNTDVKRMCKVFKKRKNTRLKAQLLSLPKAWAVNT